MDKNSKIYVSGHQGMVGRAMLRFLSREGYGNVVVKTSSELDLRRQKEVEDFIKRESPEHIFHFAAKVGGIKANVENPAGFLYDNIMIEVNVINAAHKCKVKKLLYLGSSCVYPRNCPQPMKEDYLLSGKLEPTNEGYALAKIMGLKLCEYYNKQFGTNFISLMPPNLYGPNDNFDFENSHVVAALIRKFIEAKKNNKDSVEVWGTGKARREFLYVDDVAKACFYFMNNCEAKDLGSFVNIGCGRDVSIRELVEIISSSVGYVGNINWDSSLPDGMPQKLLNIALAKKLGFESYVSLEVGIKKTIEWYRNEFF